MTVHIKPKAAEVLDALAKAKDMSKQDIVSEAVLLYNQVIADTLYDGKTKQVSRDLTVPDFYAELPEEEAREAERRFLYSYGYMRLAEASEVVLGRSLCTVRKWVKNGWLVYPDGQPIPIYRAKKPNGERWFSPQNLWDIAHAMRRRRVYSEPEFARVLLRVQQALVIQQARLRLETLRNDGESEESGGDE